MKILLLSWTILCCWQDTTIRINDGKVYTYVNGTCIDSLKWIDFRDSIEMLPKEKRDYTIDKLYYQNKPK